MTGQDWSRQLDFLCEGQVLDKTSVIGIVGATAMIVGSMVYAGGVLPFVDIPSFLIVFGGTFFVVMTKAPAQFFKSHFVSIGKAFRPTVFHLPEVIDKLVELATIARKDGLMALQGHTVQDQFFQTALEMLVDGVDEPSMTKALKLEVIAMKQRHEGNQSVIQGWIDYGPAMGMVGTLVGLVLMLGGMSDPQTIGPAMAVALLTTLYGALIANVIFGPILEKLQRYTENEITYRKMVIEGVRAISQGKPPRAIKEQLLPHLSLEQRTLLAAA